MMLQPRAGTPPPITHPTNPTTPLSCVCVCVCVSSRRRTSPLEGERLALWHALELDELVVGAVGRQHGAGVLEVLALCLALERLHGGVVEPVGEEDASHARTEPLGVLPPEDVLEGQQGK